MSGHPGSPLLRAVSFRTLALTLTLAGGGGILFALLHLPLAWMLGAMAATTAAALSGARVGIPPLLRAVMMAVLGVMLGASFTPEVLDRARLWPWSLSALVPYVFVTTLGGWLFLHRVRGMDRLTACFTAAPGGLSEMVTVGSALGGDTRTIALSHALRILIVVALVPPALRLWSGQPLPPAPPPFAFFAPGIVLPDPVEALWLLACLLTLVPARRFRVPAGVLLVPLFVSAGVHIAGLAGGKPPALLVVVAQVVVGGAMGCRFAGADGPLLRRALGSALVLTLAMLGVGFGLALVLGPLTATPIPVLMLAYAPGGLPEMCVVAFALGLDVTFVSTHHLVRVLVIILVIPAVGRWIARLTARQPAPFSPASTIGPGNPVAPEANPPYSQTETPLRETRRWKP